MGRSPCCDEIGVKKGPWTPEEDKKLVDYIQENGHGSWRNLPKSAGLNRCGKSCRLRWTNYLRPDIKRGKFTEDEERIIIHLHSVLGNKWSAIASHLSGRTDNEIKNYWNTHLKKKLLLMGIDPITHRRRTDLDMLSSLPSLLAAASNLRNLTVNPDLWDNSNIDVLRLNVDAAHLAKVQIMQSLIQLVASNSNSPTLDAINLLGSSLSLGSNSTSNHFGDILQMNRQLEAVLNGSLSIDSTAPGNLEIFSNNLQGYSAQDQNDNSHEVMTNKINAFANISTVNSAPSLVLASVEHAGSDQMQGNNNFGNSKDFLANSSPSIQYDAWESLNPNDDLGWNEILDQTSWSNGASYMKSPDYI